jgi:Leucine-rich repeat (LRR) protein
MQVLIDQVLESIWAGGRNVDDQGVACPDELRDLKSLHLFETKVTDDGVRQFAERHPEMKQLSLHAYIYGSELSDRAVVSLRKLSKLEKLSLAGTRITDDGAAPLASLRHLREVNFARTNITDDALRHLADLRELEHLNLTKTRVAGPGLEHLRELPHLEYLFLDGTLVTDTMIPHLEQMNSLVQLGLSETKVTDEGIAKFKLPPNLIWLSLDGTEITDRSLAALARYPRLSGLDVRNTKVTAVGVAAFAKACPNCELRISRESRPAVYHAEHFGPALFWVAGGCRPWEAGTPPPSPTTHKRLSGKTWPRRQPFHPQNQTLYT